MNGVTDIMGMGEISKSHMCTEMGKPWSTVACKNGENRKTIKKTEKEQSRLMEGNTVKSTKFSDG